MCFENLTRMQGMNQLHAVCCTTRLRIMSRDTAVDTYCEKSLFNFRLQTEEIVGSVFYDGNFMVFRKRFSFSSCFPRSVLTLIHIRVSLVHRFWYSVGCSSKDKYGPDLFSKILLHKCHCQPLPMMKLAHCKVT